MLSTCFAEYLCSLTLWTNVFSTSLITHVHQWVSSCSLLSTCSADYFHSLTLWMNIFSTSLITCVHQWVSSCSLLSTCSAEYLFIFILWMNIFSTLLITYIQYSSLIATNIKLFKLSILVSFRCRVSSKWFAKMFSFL